VSLIGDMVIRFTADTRGAKAGVKGLNKSLGGLQAGMAMVGLNMVKNITQPLFDMGVASIQTAANFQYEMQKVANTAGAVGDDFEILRHTALRMGESTIFTASKAAEAMNFLALAGWETEQIMIGLPPILDLAAVSGENMGKVADIVTDAMTAFGMSASEVTRFVDVMTATATNSNTNIRQMGVAFQYAAPLAGNLGYSIEDTALTLGLMASSSVKASKSGTALRTMFTNLITAGEEETEILKILNTELIDSKTKAIIPLKEVIDNLREGYSGLTAGMKIQVTESLTNKRAMSGVLAVVNASPKSYDKLAKAIATSKGATRKLAEAMNNTTLGRFKLLQARTEKLGISFGDTFEVPLQRAMFQISRLLYWIDGWEDETKNLVMILGMAIPVGLALGVVIAGVALLMAAGVLPFILLGVAIGVLIGELVYLGSKWETVWLVMQARFNEDIHRIAKGMRWLMEKVGALLEGMLAPFAAVEKSITGFGSAVQMAYGMVKSINKGIKVAGFKSDMAHATKQVELYTKISKAAKDEEFNMIEALKAKAKAAKEVVDALIQGATDQAAMDELNKLLEGDKDKAAAAKRKKSLEDAKEEQDRVNKDYIALVEAFKDSVVKSYDEMGEAIVKALDNKYEELLENVEFDHDRMEKKNEELKDSTIKDAEDAMDGKVRSQEKATAKVIRLLDKELTKITVNSDVALRKISNSYAARDRILNKNKSMEEKSIQAKLDALDAESDRVEKAIDTQKFLKEQKELEKKVSDTETPESRALQSQLEKNRQARIETERLKDANIQDNESKSYNERMRLSEIYNDKLADLAVENKDLHEKLDIESMDTAKERAKAIESLDKLRTDRVQDQYKDQQKMVRDSIVKELDAVRGSYDLYIDESKTRFEEETSQEKRAFEASVEFITQRKSAVKTNSKEIIQSYKEEATELKLHAEEKYEATVESLTKQKIATEKMFEDLRKTEALEAEARQLIISDSQDDILLLLDEYNSDWLEQGKSFGQNLLDGLLSKKADIQTEIASIMESMNQVRSLQDIQKSLMTPTVPSFGGISSVPRGFSTLSPSQAGGTTVHVDLDGQRLASAVAGPMVRHIKLAGVR